MAVASALMLLAANGGLALATLAGAVVRVSLPSLAYLLLFLSFAAAPPLPRRGCCGALLRPLLAIGIALLSLALEAARLATGVPLAGSAALDELFGLASGAPHAGRIALFFSADALVLAANVVALIVCRRPIKSKDDSSTSSAAADDAAAAVPSPPSELVDQRRKRSGSGSGKQRRLWLRSALTVLAAVAAAAFLPGALGMPYAALVLSCAAFLAAGALPLGRWLAATELPTALYAAAHAVVVYVYQFDTVHAAMAAQGQWLGLVHHTAFLGTWSAWYVWVAYAALLVLAVLAAPALCRCLNCCCCGFRRRGDTKECGGHRGRSRSSRTLGAAANTGLTERLLGFAEELPEAVSSPLISSTSTTTVLTPRTSDTRLRLHNLLYPHGWKVILLGLLAACFAAPGIPTALLMLYVFVCTFLQSKTAARTSPALLVYFGLCVSAQYVASVPFPAIRAARETHGDTLDDFSLPQFSDQTAGLFLGAELLGLVLIAAFVRLNNVLGRMPPRRLQSQRSSSSQQQPQQRQEEEEEPTRWKRFKDGFKQNAKLGFFLVIKYSYLISLIAVYFACLRGTNVINFVLIIIFLAFLVSPDLATRWWSVLVRYTQFVLLLRFIWQIHWTPPESRAARIIGLEKDPSVSVLVFLVWELVVVVFVSIQMYFLRLLNVDAPAKQKKADDHSDDGDSRVQRDLGKPRRRDTFMLGKSFASLEQAARLSWWNSVSAVLEVVLRDAGLLACYLAFVLVGTLMPISAVSLSYLGIVFACLLLHYHFSSGRKHVRRLWMGFMIWEAIVLFSCYAFQFQDLQELLDTAYSASGFARFLTLSEWGLMVFPPGYMFLGLLPHVSLLAINTIQYRIFRHEESKQKQKTTSAESPALTLPKWLGAIIDFCKRFVFAFTPFALFLFMAIIFLREVSAVHLVLVAVLLFSRLHNKGQDLMGALFVWFSELVCVLILVLNLSFFDAFFDANPGVARWIGVPLDYAPGSPTSAHPENVRMLGSYLGVVVLALCEKISYRWGFKKAQLVGRLRENPRELPLIAALDNYPSLPEKRKTLGLRFFNLLSTLPVVFSVQMSFIALCLCLYFRSDAAIGIFYFAALSVGISVSRKTLSRLLKPFVLVVALLLCVQYFAMLGLPPSLRPPADASSSSSSFSSPQVSASTSFSFSSSSTPSHAWPWHSWSVELRTWLLLYLPFPGILVADALLIYFASATSFLPHNHRDFFSLFRVAPSNDTFPSSPRTLGDSARYYFLQSIAVLIIVGLFLVGTSSETVLSLVFLLASLALLFSGDFLFARPKHWRTLLGVAQFIVFAQLCYQLAYVVLRQLDSNHIDTMHRVGLVLGFDFSPVTTWYASNTVLLTVGLLFVLVCQQSAASGLEREFTLTRAYKESQRAQEELKARKLLAAQYDKTIAQLHEAFAEKRARRERLQTLRESRKRKALMWPQLADEFDDATTMSVMSERAGGLSTHQGVTPEHAGDVADEEMEEKLTFKQRIANIRGLVRCLILNAIDRTILYMHGPEGLSPDSPFANDLEALKQEMEHRTPRSEALSARVESAAETPAVSPAVVDVSGQDDAATSASAAAAMPSASAPPPSSTASTPAPGSKRLRIRTRLALQGIGHVLFTNSQAICMLAFVANHLFNGTLLSLVYVILGFGFVVFSQAPRPGKRFWRGVLVYCATTLCLKFLVQVPGVCMCHGERVHYWWFSGDSIDSGDSSMTCPQRSCNYDSGRSAAQFSLPYLVGVVPHEQYFGIEAIWDFLVLLVILFHLYQMQRQGVWGERMSSAIAEERKRFLDQLHKLETEEAREAPVHVVALCDVPATPARLGFHEGDVIRVLLRGHKPGPTSIGELNGVAGLFDLENTRPLEVHALPDEGDEITLAGELDVEAQTAEAAEVAAEDASTSAAAIKEATEEISADEEEEKKKKGKCASALVSAKRFFKGLLKNMARLGVDMYTPVFLIDFACFFYLIIFAANFTGSSGQLIEYISQSYLPGLYVAVLLFQFVIILVDRIVYIVKSPTTKLAIQLATLVLYNLVMMFYFPWRMEMDAATNDQNWKAPFTQSGLLQFLFLLKVVYWWLSGVQVREGYPMVSGERFLMRGYNSIQSIAFLVYRAIPFVYELRTIMDWTFTKTTLGFWNYLKVEDVYAEVYNNKCTMVAEAKRKRKPGQARVMSEKLSTGCLLFLVIVAVLWLPLLLLSSAFPGMSGVKLAPANRVDINAEISGWVPFYTQTASTNASLGHKLTDAEFREIRLGRPFISNDRNELQVVSLQSYSETLWSITDPSKRALLRALENTEVDIRVAVSLQVSRKSGSNANVAFKHETVLNADDRAKLLEVIRAGNGSSVVLVGIVPRFIKMPGTTSEATTPCTESPDACVAIRCMLTYSVEANGDEWWEFSTQPASAESLFNNTAPVLVLINTPVSSSSSIIGSVAALGLIGIYTTIILAVANFIRSMTAGLSRAIMFENMPESAELLQLCKDIILARNDGDLLLEEELANELIQIYRSPEAIIERTRPKQKAD